eukprot:TRINITY_DN10880_c0_g1_i1.p2 TRINITY_DN10880_c0_g1~~TRINITY_DN10880_c0_g1_i1.p2  ORF type:complete len:197 (+),score=47.15 TRINITY_DN10880_c0_g1_i1:53-592(+)
MALFISRGSSITSSSSLWTPRRSMVPSSRGYAEYETNEKAAVDYIRKGSETEYDLATFDKKTAADINGAPAEQLNRHAIIYKPGKFAGQHGWGNTKSWKIKFAPGPKWTNPLMGWTSGSDPLGQVTIKDFPTKQSAIDYCNSNGFGYDVDESDHSQVKNPRTYASKFQHVFPVADEFEE